VIDVDTAHYALSKVVSQLPDCIVEGLAVRLSGGAVTVTSGVAVVGKKPLVLKGDVVLPASPSAGYINIKGDEKYEMQLEVGASPATPLARYDITKNIATVLLPKLSVTLLPLTVFEVAAPSQSPVEIPLGVGVVVVTSSGDVTLKLPTPVAPTLMVVTRQGAGRVIIDGMGELTDKASWLLYHKGSWLKIN
jgi:hypothetical protein